MEEEPEPAIKKQLHLHTPRRRRLLLRITLAQPDAVPMIGYSSWKPFTFLNVYVGDSQTEPLEFPIEKRHVEGWKRAFEINMDSRWPRMSVDLEAVRADCGIGMDGRLQVLRADEPHTSRHTAVIGRARVPLLDALLFGEGDSEDEGAKDKKKRRLERDGKEVKLAEGTRVFRERVKLQGWQAPAPGDVGGEPSNVVCGTVAVLLEMTEE